MSAGGAGGLPELFRLAARLKETARAGWLLRGVPRSESVADHSFRVALMALVLAPREDAGLDRARCVALALVHDLAECLVGDITPHDGVPANEKRRREDGAMRHLAHLAGDDELLWLWREYDAGHTPEARFVKQLDRLETALQAVEYGRDAAPGALDEFVENARRAVTLPALRAVLEASIRAG